MTEKKDRRIASDGYSSNQVLREGYLRKGGSNSAVSQVQTRPPAPAPMRPASESNTGAVKPSAGGDAKKG